MTELIELRDSLWLFITTTLSNPYVVAVMCVSISLQVALVMTVLYKNHDDDDGAFP